VNKRYVVFSHGQDSDPWGRKIQVLSTAAKSEGYEVESVDYRGIDSPLDRAQRLADVCKNISGELVLVGSSLGGYVSLANAAALHVRGVFLMAPAIYMPGLPPLRVPITDCPTTIVHGWGDEVVPAQDSIRFATEHNATLHLIDGDHRLHAQIPLIKYLFEYFLISLDMVAPLR
jgi:pimeloyl-ACP methyl ester carboxylesterase